MRVQILIIFLSFVLVACKNDNPQALLAVGCNQDWLGAGKRAQVLQEPNIEARIEAIRALLKLQRSKFNVTLPPVAAQDTTGIDHIYLETLKVSEDGVTLLFTPELKAGRHATEGDYWSIEKLTFEKSGKLISREAYKER